MRRLLSTVNFIAITTLADVRFTSLLKIHDGGRHLEFWKNINNSRLDKYICTKFYWKMQHSHAEMTT